MSKKEKATPVLPTEVVMEILSFLPLRPLARAQLVCREWGAMIQDHHFTEKHMNRTPFLEYWYNVVVTGEGGKSGSGFCYLHGCDGLLLIKNHLTDMHLLWNPASRLLLELPPPQYGSYGFALSFVPSTKNYRLVSFFKDKDSGKHACQILTPGPSMEWRGLEFPELVNGNASVVPAGGDAHCVVVNGTVVEIVSLDVEAEVLTLNRLPEGVFRGVGDAKAIDCDGKVGVAVVGEEEVEVMVLEDFKKGRWCRKKEVIPLPFLGGERFKGRNVVVLFIKEGEVWLGLEDERVFVYTVETGKIRDEVKRKGICMSSIFYSYKPSLVGFEGMKADDEVKKLRRQKIRLD